VVSVKMIIHSSNNTSIDALDRAIIKLLSQDGRMAFSEIAKQLDIPETTARYRVQRLLQTETIKIAARTSPEKLGKPHILIVWLNIENTQIDAVVQELAAMDEVVFVGAIAAGRYNVVVDIYFGMNEEMFVFFDKIQKIRGIINYESHLLRKLFKAEYDRISNF
jgi:Lrp/AsnC family transcriptional regulator, regulator for asnA, asnC and gidA